MTSAAALLPLCIAIAILALVLAVFLWARGRRGRALQALGVSVVAVGLYLTGLLSPLWEAVLAFSRWGSRVVFNPLIWTGAALIALAVVLWIAGGVLAGRRRTQAAVERRSGSPSAGRETTTRGNTPAVGSSTREQSAAPAKAKKGKQAAPADPEMDEIEALLKRRGIE